MAATGTPTPNIGLRIPIGTDPASVDDINYNSNLIDTKLGAVGSDSVQDQIDALNSKLTVSSTKPTSSNSFTWSDNSVAKFGQIVVIQSGRISRDNNLPASTWATIGVLPEGYRPAHELFTPAYDYTNDLAGCVRIYTNGDIDVFSTSASKSFLVNAVFVVS